MFSITSVLGQEIISCHKLQVISYKMKSHLKIWPKYIKQSLLNVVSLSISGKSEAFYSVHTLEGVWRCSPYTGPGMKPCGGQWF